MYNNNKKVLIPFSADIAQRMAGEESATLPSPANEASYKTKRASKNLVDAPD